VLGRNRRRGFTLIELAIAIALLGILMMLGVPAFSTYIQNARLRGAAENFYAGVQMARAEAVRRNTTVQIILTSEPGVDTSANTDVLTLTGPNWIVRAQRPGSVFYDFVEGKTMTEGSAEQIGGTPAVTVTGTVSSVGFNGLGAAASLAGAATFEFKNPAGGGCAAEGGPMRCLNVMVSVGGQARMCDPAVTTAGDTRKC